MYLFIDESGNAGTNGHGGRWFFVAGAMVAGWRVDEIKALVSPAIEIAAPKAKALHMKDVNTHERRLAAYELLSPSDLWAGVVVMSDCDKVPPRLSEPRNHQFEVLRIAIERGLWMAARSGERLTVYFDKAYKRMPIDEFRAYLATGDKTPDDTVTDWTLLDLVDEAEPEDQLGICLSDALAYSMHRITNPDQFGKTEPLYFNRIAQQIWRGEPVLPPPPPPYPQPEPRAPGGVISHQYAKDMMTWSGLINLQTQQRQKLQEQARAQRGPGFKYGMIILPPHSVWEVRQEYSWLTRFDQ